MGPCRAVVGMIGWDHPGGSVRGDAAGRGPEPALVTRYLDAGQGS